MHARSPPKGSQDKFESQPQNFTNKKPSTVMHLKISGKNLASLKMSSLSIDSDNIFNIHQVATYIR